MSDDVRNVLVAGGAGGVGEGIVRALLASVPDVRVIATSRSADRLAMLESRLGAYADVNRLIGIVGDAGHSLGADAIRDRIRAEVGQLDIAIPSLGGWWEGGALLDVDLATWDAVMLEMLDIHFVFARTFVPELQRRPGGWYLAIGGGAAFFPVPNASIVSIAAAAQLMMTRALAAENKRGDVRITELVVNGPVRTRDSETMAQPDWITAEDVGTVVADLVRSGSSSWPLRRDGPILIMNPRGR